MMGFLPSNESPLTPWCREGSKVPVPASAVTQSWLCTPARS
jgi:hypothetical protein